jgi:hypothetical protein
MGRRPKAPASHLGGRRLSSGGGSAAQAGFRFQNEVAAYFVVHLLAAEPVQQLGLGDGGRPTSVHAEVSAPVDDLLVLTEAGGRVFVNVKRTVEISMRPRSALWSAADQIVRLKLMTDAGGVPPWGGVLDPGCNRLVIAFDSTTSARLTRAGGTMRAVAGRPASVPRADVPTNADERALLDAVERILAERWEALTERPPLDGQIDALCRLIRFLPLDLGGGDLARAHQLLRPTLKQSEDASAAWLVILAHCASLAMDRTAADLIGVRAALAQAGIPLAGSPAHRGDVERLRRFSVGPGHLPHARSRHQGGRRRVAQLDSTGTFGGSRPPRPVLARPGTAAYPRCSTGTPGRRLPSELSGFPASPGAEPDDV